MSFDGLLEHQITTYRMLPNPLNANQSTSQINLQNQNCLIQPVTAEFAAKTGMVFGRSYNLLAPLEVDVQISDRVVDQDGKTYQVTGSLKRNYGFNTPHMTYYMTEESGATPDK